MWLSTVAQALARKPMQQQHNKSHHHKDDKTRIAKLVDGYGRTLLNVLQHSAYALASH
jgi:hypothetical protein